MPKVVVVVVLVVIVVIVVVNYLLLNLISILDGGVFTELVVFVQTSESSSTSTLDVEPVAGPSHSSYDVIRNTPQHIMNTVCFYLMNFCH